jgi:hypothetical protein
MFVSMIPKKPDEVASKAAEAGPASRAKETEGSRAALMREGRASSAVSVKGRSVPTLPERGLGLSVGAWPVAQIGIGIGSGGLIVDRRWLHGILPTRRPSNITLPSFSRVSPPEFRGEADVRKQAAL